MLSLEIKELQEKVEHFNLAIRETKAAQKIIEDDFQELNFSRMKQELREDFMREHDLPALSSWDDGFLAGNVKRKDMEDLEERGLTEWDETFQIWDLSALNEMLLEKIKDEVNHVLERLRKKIPAFQLLGKFANFAEEDCFGYSSSLKFILPATHKAFDEPDWFISEYEQHKSEYQHGREPEYTSAELATIDSFRAFTDVCLDIWIEHDGSNTEISYSTRHADNIEWPEGTKAARVNAQDFCARLFKYCSEDDAQL